MLKKFHACRCYGMLSPQRLKSQIPGTKWKQKYQGLRNQISNFFHSSLWCLLPWSLDLEWSWLEMINSKAIFQKVFFFCTNEKSGFNDGLQVDLIFSLFLEFELGLHLRISDLWPLLRIQVPIFWNPLHKLYLQQYSNQRIL